MNRGIKLMTVRGIEVRLNWSLFLIIGLITFSLATGLYPEVMQGWGAGAIIFAALISAVGLFASVLLHELAHSLLAQRFGMKVEEIVLHLFGGVSNLKEDPKTARQEFWIAVIGPLTSLGLGGLLLLLSFVAGEPNPAIGAILTYLGLMNLMLGFFNLLPAFPLDGGRVLRSLIWGATKSPLKATRIAAGSGRVIGWLFIFLGILALLNGGLTGLWLGLIGWFINSAARASYMQAVMQYGLKDAKVGQMLWQSWRVLTPEMPLAMVMSQGFGLEPQRVVPVLQEGYLMGIFNPWEAAQKYPPADWQNLTVQNVMTWRGSLLAFRPEDDLQAALQTMVEKQTPYAAVIGDLGQFAGLIYLADFPRFMQLREKFGLAEPTRFTPNGMGKAA